MQNNMPLEVQQQLPSLVNHAKKEIAKLGGKANTIHKIDYYSIEGTSYPPIYPPTQNLYIKFDGGSVILRKTNPNPTDPSPTWIPDDVYVVEPSLDMDVEWTNKVPDYYKESIQDPRWFKYSIQYATQLGTTELQKSGCLPKLKEIWSGHERNPSPVMDSNRPEYLYLLFDCGGVYLERLGSGGWGYSNPDDGNWKVVKCYKPKSEQKTMYSNRVFR